MGKFLANSLWQENGDLPQLCSGQLCDPWTGKGTSLSLRFPICELGWGRCLSQTKCAEGVCLLRNASGLLEPPIPSPSPSGPVSGGAVMATRQATGGMFA